MVLSVKNVLLQMNRYSVIWDVSIVLNYLKFLYPLEDIQYSVLSYKCVMLLALASMQRVQTLHAIEVSDINFCDGYVLIPIKKIIKQSSARKNKFMIRLKYHCDPSICPVLTLKSYIEKSKKLRGQEKQLFISFQKPYMAVSKSTLSRWIRCVMDEAGIDTSYFKPHSTRAASSSSALINNVPIDEILETAGWSNSKTFKKFYNKTVISTNS